MDMLLDHRLGTKTLPAAPEELLGVIRERSQATLRGKHTRSAGLARRTLRQRLGIIAAAACVVIGMGLIVLPEFTGGGRDGASGGSGAAGFADDGGKGHALGGVTVGDEESGEEDQPSKEDKNKESDAEPDEMPTVADELRRNRGGGGKPNYKRVEAGLQWLADHQNKGGYWSSTKFAEDSIRTEKGAQVTGNVDFDIENESGWDGHDIGMTGLSLLAFVGDGHTHESGKFSKTVQRGLDWLLKQQDDEGCFPKDKNYVYEHAVATMALVEIYIMSGQEDLKDPAQKAVDFIVECQSPGMGWHFAREPGRNDSSITACMVLALKSAKIAGLDFDHETVFAGANAWYDKVTGPDGNGRVRTGYVARASGTPRLFEAADYEDNSTMDACAINVRLFTGSKDKDDEILTQQAGYLVKGLPAWYKGDKEENGPWKIDFYYWYYASLACFQMGSAYWKPWEAALFSPCLLKYQRGWHPKDIEEFGKDISKTGDGDDSGRWKLDEHGSWDAVDAWGAAGGRVYSTAINTLTLEIYYRYQRVKKE